MINIKNVYFKFKKDYRYSNIINILLTIIGIGLIGFIAFSFNRLDLSVSNTLFKAMLSVSFFKYLFSFIFTVATRIILVFVAACGMIVIESMFKYYKFKKYNMVCWFHAGIIGFYIIGEMLFCYNGYYTANKFWGNILDFNFLIKGIYDFAFRILAASIFIAFLSFMFYYVHFKLAKREDFADMKYCKNVVAMILALAFGYLIIIIIKQTTGRPNLAYYNFEEIYGKLNKDNTSITWSHYILEVKGLDLDALEKAVIADVQNNRLKPKDGFLEWYQINGNFWSNLKFTIPLNFLLQTDMSKAPTGFMIIDFPSGHTYASMLLINFGVVFVYKEKTAKWKRHLFTIIWGAWMLLVISSLSFSGIHWFSDIFATMIIGPIVILLSYHFNNKLYEKQVAKLKGNEWKWQLPILSTLLLVIVLVA